MAECTTSTVRQLVFRVCDGREHVHCGLCRWGDIYAREADCLRAAEEEVYDTSACINHPFGYRGVRALSARHFRFRHYQDSSLVSTFTFLVDNVVAWDVQGLGFWVKKVGFGDNSDVNLKIMEEGLQVRLFIMCAEASYVEG